MITGDVVSVDGPYYTIKNAVYQCTKGGAVSRNTSADVYLRFNKTGGMEGFWISKTDEAHSKYRDEVHFSATYQHE
ncbi:MAG: hypothetical protein FWC42_01305 [Proteobacteria bacterium]|nr:hypothetical protein [Pseudomonadota bacterium]